MTSPRLSTAMQAAPMKIASMLVAMALGSLGAVSPAMAQISTLDADADFASRRQRRRRPRMIASWSVPTGLRSREPTGAQAPRSGGCTTSTPATLPELRSSIKGSPTRSGRSLLSTDRRPSARPISAIPSPVKRMRARATTVCVPFTIESRRWMSQALLTAKYQHSSRTDGSMSRRLMGICRRPG